MKFFSRRVVAEVLAFVMVFSMVAMPVSAEEILTKYDAAAFLKEKNLLQGDESGNLMLDKQLTREQMMVIMSRLLNKENEAKNYSTDFMTFQDVDLNNGYSHYIAWAQDNGITQGYSQDEFGFGKPLTAWQTEALFVRALGFKDVLDQDMEAKAAALGVSNGSTVEASSPILRVDMAQLMYNTISARNSDNNILANVIGVELPDQHIVPLEITASAVGASTVKVTFNRAVADTSKITFALTRSSIIGGTLAWNSDKTEATLTTSSVLEEGAYNVKVEGDTFAVDKDTASFIVVKSGIGKIQFTSDKLVKDALDKTKATLRYKITDNYGIDITKTTLASEFTVAASKTISSFTVDSNNGIMTLTFNSAILDSDTSAVVTIIGLKDGVPGTATLTFSDAPRVDVATLKSIDYPQTTPATTKILVGKSLAAYILLDVKDQYGNDVNSKAILDSDVLFIKSDSKLNLNTEEYTDSTGTKKLRIVVDTTGITVGKIVNVTAVSKLEAKTSVITLDIKDSAVADKVQIGNAESMIAAKDASGTLALPMTVIDQYGVQLSPDEIIANVDNGNIVITSDSGLVAEIGRTGANKGKIINKDANSTVGTHVITVTTKTGNVATKTVEVKEQAYEASMKVANTPALNLLMGASTKLNYTFFDQYGRKIVTPSGATDVSLEVADASIIKATVGALSTSASNKVIQTKASQLYAENAVKIETASNAGSAVLTAKLLRNSTVISTAQTTFAVVAGVPASLTFQIADIPTLPSRDAVGLVNGTDKHARPIVISAKDQSGITYAIPSNIIMGVTSTDTNLLVLSSAPAVSSTIKDQDGNYLVAAKDKSTAFTSSDPLTKTATVKVLVATDAGIIEVAKSVTVSKEEPKVDKIVFADKDLKAGYPYSLDADAKEVTTLVGTSADVAAAPIYVFEVDQYGVYNKVAAPVFKIANLDRFSGTLSYDQADSTLNFSAAQIKANQPVFIMYLSSSGAYNTFSIQASNGTL